ncbi:MAG: hypothetical protein HYY52_06420 [Candidatus Melainabacteria bacterium]|nr:hypothetical protein [Candidatus Melainabacteria bacterium]
MSTITETNNLTSGHCYSFSRKENNKTWDTFKDIASIVCSRESTYRTALDITAFDAPLILSDLFRGIKKTLESAFEGLSGTVLVVISPFLTTFTGKALAKFVLPKEMQKDATHLLRFSMSELRDFEKFKKAKERIKLEEVEDKNFLASLYRRNEKNKNAEYYEEQGKQIKEFCDRFEPTEENLKLIYKLKKTTIIGESMLEGGYWGGFGLLIRAFRKYILKEDRFTGTIGYASDEESQALGESGDLSLFQKIIGTGAIFVSPVLNSFLLAKSEDDQTVEKSSFLKVAREHLDMTHGVYPKLGLLFTQTSVPKWIGVITTSQGWYERFERILKLFTVLPSWWLGHRVTNGLFAKFADAKLTKKYNSQKGILVEPKYLEEVKKEDSFFTKLSKWFPEPAKIHHVMKTTEEDKVLQNEAEELHAKCLYKGFALHSAIVWIVNMTINYITKLRVKYALGQ